jgi:hypothetical protein
MALQTALEDRTPVRLAEDIQSRHDLQGSVSRTLHCVHALGFIGVPASAYCGVYEACSTRCGLIMTGLEIVRAIDERTVLTKR